MELLPGATDEVGGEGGGGGVVAVVEETVSRGSRGSGRGSSKNLCNLWEAVLTCISLLKVAEKLMGNLEAMKELSPTTMIRQGMGPDEMIDLILKVTPQKFHQMC